MKCPKCENEFEGVELNYCPICGTPFHKVEAEVQEFNIYDKSTILTNCRVEIWENTATGEQSIGWYRTEDTEEFEE